MNVADDETHARCPHCGYDLYPLTGESDVRCPECGKTTPLAELRTAYRQRSSTLQNFACVVFAPVAGWLSWRLPAAASGEVEAWDGGLYWLWMLMTAVSAAALGWLGSRFWWCWPFILTLTEFSGMMLTGGRGDGLWPFGLCLMIGFGTFCLAPAAIGARFRERERGRAALRNS